MTENVLQNWESELRNTVVMTDDGMTEESFKSIFPDLEARLLDTDNPLSDDEITTLVSIGMDLSFDHLHLLWHAVGQQGVEVMLNFHKQIVSRFMKLHDGLPVEYRKQSASSLSAEQA